MNIITESIQQLGIDTVRVLVVDAVQEANSGHPATPMRLAAVGHVLWAESVNYNPQNPEWANRDRLILLAGHACMLQYGFLYLTGYSIPLKDLKSFRQLHNKTAGEFFEKQDAAYKEKIFSEKIRKRLAVEAGSLLGWHKYVTDDGDLIGIDRYGESALGDEVMSEYVLRRRML